MNELPEGQIFFLSVVISDGLYKSQMASPIAIESPLKLTDIVVSSPNVAGIVVCKRFNLNYFIFFLIFFLFF